MQVLMLCGGSFKCVSICRCGGIHVGVNAVWGPNAVGIPHHQYIMARFCSCLLALFEFPTPFP